MLRIIARGGVVALEIAHLKNVVEQGIRRESEGFHNPGKEGDIIVRACG
jgi:hypothetical protein